MSNICFKKWRMLLFTEPVSVDHDVVLDEELTRSSIGTAQQAISVSEEV